MNNTKSLKKSSSGSSKIRLYDVVSHRSYSVDRKSVNIYQTRGNKNCVVLHLNSKEIGGTPSKKGILFVTHKRWSKIANRSRTTW